MIADPVTARYATALHNLARRRGVVDAVAADLAAIAAELARPATRALIFNPRVEREAKRAQLGPVLGGANLLTRNLVNLLFDKNRQEVLKGLESAFRRLRLEERGELEGVVESSRPLPPAEVARLSSALGPRLSRRLVLLNRIDPELVGGVRVTAGNRMIDYSVQGRLEALRRRMLDARLPQSS